jgi:hypothetical protein
MRGFLAVAKILKIPKRHKHRKDRKDDITPPAEIIEFPNNPQAQLEYSTVKRWLKLADEMLIDDSGRKKG